MENKQEKRGGIRNGAGRKKLNNAEKKVEIKFWVENKFTFPIGGIEKTRDFALKSVKEFGIQNLNEPTHQIKPITDQKPLSNTIMSVQPQNAPISQYNEFRERLKDCKTIAEIEKVMSGVKAALMLPREKMSLEQYAKELSKDMYTD